MVKLELGSGDRPTPGWTHMDIRPDAPEVDIVGDAQDPLPGSSDFEAIRATHLLEHFSHRETVPILMRWRGLLADGGELYLEVPNLTGHIAAWDRNQSSDAQLVEYLFGEQDHEYNFHKTMFTPGTLYKVLRDAGFESIEIQDVGLVLCATAR